MPYTENNKKTNKLMSNNIHIIEMGEGTSSVELTAGLTLGALMSTRNTNKHVTVKVNNERKDNDYQLQPGDQVQLIPNVEAGV